MLAKGQLAEEHPDNPHFSSVMAEGLVMRNHYVWHDIIQLNSHFVHKVTHRNLVCSYNIIYNVIPLHNKLITNILAYYAD